MCLLFAQCSGLGEYFRARDTVDFVWVPITSRVSSIRYEEVVIAAGTATHPSVSYYHSHIVYDVFGNQLERVGVLVDQDSFIPYSERVGFSSTRPIHTIGKNI
jgi:hypothetical protein